MENEEIKSKLHSNNKHHGRYDFEKLISSEPSLASFVHTNKYQIETIDFFDPLAVKALNKALLVHFYDINYWNIPDGYLCPPIPGRADYIHYMAELLSYNMPKAAKIKCLDIGVGANCIYPIIAVKEYDWQMVGTDIDTIAIENAKDIIHKNKSLQGKIEIRMQQNASNIFEGSIFEDEYFDMVICNPPFHASAKEANASTLRKVSNLKNKKTLQPILNFGGQHNELWCTGGETQFIRNMIQESYFFKNQIKLCSSLVSKETTLKSCIELLKKLNAVHIQIIPMGQGNKISRILVWKW